VSPSFKIDAFIFPSFYLFIYLCGYPGQLARTTTNLMAHYTSCKPNEHVKHRGMTGMHSKIQTQVQKKKQTSTTIKPKSQVHFPFLSCLREGRGVVVGLEKKKNIDMPFAHTFFNFFNRLGS
jgi:hypothetical protein